MLRSQFQSDLHIVKHANRRKVPVHNG